MSFRRLLPVLVVAVCATCSTPAPTGHTTAAGAAAAAPTPGSAVPLNVEVLESGYLAGNTIMVGSDELKAYLSDHAIADIRLVPGKDATPGRMRQATRAVQDAGIHVVD